MNDADLQPGRLAVNGYEFRAYAVGPESGDLVLLLHGFPQFANAWTPIMPAIAAAGYRVVAVDQRGYSPEARPDGVDQYATTKLCSDVLGFAEALGAREFHLVGHDWGGILAWQIAAEHPDRLLSLTVLSTPHIDAFLEAIANDDDQKRRSQYIELFRMPGGAAETYLAAKDWQFLRRVYQEKLTPAAVEENVRRLAEPGALTAALNWYRALDIRARIGSVTVPTLYIWGSEDIALGETAARSTEKYVNGEFHFEPLEGKSHWLLEEAPEWIAARILRHLQSRRAAATRL